MKDFFISYHNSDKEWASLIEKWLNEIGYSTLMQDTDFKPGSNFVLMIDESIKNTNKTIAIISPDYLKADFPQIEWPVALANDPTGKKKKLIPVKVRNCEIRGLLSSIVNT